MIVVIETYNDTDLTNKPWSWLISGVHYPTKEVSLERRPGNDLIWYCEGPNDTTIIFKRN